MQVVGKWIGCAHRVLAIVGMFLMSAGVSAQVETAASDVVACLQPAAAIRNDVTYPEEALRAGVAGVTKVLMEFESPTEPPDVKVSMSSDPRLDRAVVEHVARYRVPCLPAGTRAQLQQEFVFAPNTRGAVSSADAIDLKQREIVACVTHLLPGTQPTYPRQTTGTSMHAIQGDDSRATVVARLRFISGDGPPLVDFPGQQESRFTQSVESWARGYRFPCYAGTAIHATQSFQFRMEGDPELKLKDLGLAEFIANARLGDEKRFFDLDRLRCPFDVQLEYLQPVMANLVRELGASAPGRQPLLDWLSTLRLDVEAKMENQLLGQSMKIAVPCGRVDL